MAVTNVKLMILAVVLSATLIQTSYALVECYACDSITTSACGSGANFKKDSLTAHISNCTSGCSKILGKSGSVEVVTRSCSATATAGGSCQSVSGAKVCTHTCITALCNDSVTLTSALPVTIMLLALVAAVQMFYKK